MLLHVAAMAQDLEVLEPLVVLVPIAVVNVETRTGAVVLTTLAMSDPVNEAGCRTRRQPVVASRWIAAKGFLTFGLSSFRSPPRLNLQADFRSLAAL